jgi:F420-dependent oxidoreductase-like protein
MQPSETLPAGRQASNERPTRERVGLVLVETEAAAAAVEHMRAAEVAGVRQVWMNQAPTAPDTLTVLAAAAVRTTTIRLGTAIVPTYPRHPLVLAQQALALFDLAPERLRLGVGPSHRPFIEGVYGLPMPSPLAHLREYVTVLRAALWQGQVDYQGRFYRVQVSMPRTPRTPILIPALREKSFHLAGELSDGAISWMCPVPYLLEKALPALQSGAAKSGRPPPPLVAHLPVALGQDRQAIRAAARQQLGAIGQFPFYAQMFAEAGFPVASDETMSDALLDSLVVFGDEATIAARLTDLLAQGLDEVHVKPLPVARPEDEQARLARLLGQL